MDYTTFALKLIKTYNEEHNRMRRAQRAWQRVNKDEEFLREMEDLGLQTFISFEKHARKYELQHALNYFRNKDDGAQFKILAFTSQKVKQKHVSEAEYFLEKALEDARGHAFERRRELEEIRKIPVRADLAKKWQIKVKAHFEDRKAYEARWEARCAIKAFNKMKTGIEIKFGCCHPNGGSISYVKYVVIDGDKLTLRRFLDNAEFESAILESPEVTPSE